MLDARRPARPNSLFRYVPRKHLEQGFKINKSRESITSMKKYAITVTFKHFDAKPLVFQSDNMPSTNYDSMRRQAVYNNGYPNTFEVACDDVLTITAVENEKAST